MVVDLSGVTIVYLVSEDWYFVSHRLPVARAARDAGARVVVATRCIEHQLTIEHEGFEVVNIDFDRSGLNPVHDLRVLVQIINCYRHFRPAIVHHVAAKPVMLGHIAVAISGVKCVINAMAGMGFLYISQTRKAKILRQIFEGVVSKLNRSKVVRIIVQNEDDATIFENLGLPRRKIALISGSGVDCERFTPSPEPEGGVVALCVSRLLRDKGLYELVDASRILKARGVPVTIRIVGGRDDNPTSVAEKDLSSWKREGIVEIAGHSKDVDQEYARSHIAVLPSYREGLPKSLLEAAASGRPIVATDVPGCRTICRDEENGILVPVKDPTAIADAIERLAGDADLRVRMGSAGRDLVLSKFSQEIVARKTLELYREALLFSRSF